jgi:hypothetical protein
MVPTRHQKAKSPTWKGWAIYLILKRKFGGWGSFEKPAAGRINSISLPNPASAGTPWVPQIAWMQRIVPAWRDLAQAGDGWHVGA